MTISEVSKQYGLSADTLRYYEKIGLLPRIGRKENGIRDYQVADCRMIEFVKYMRSAGMPVELLVEYFALVKQGESTNRKRRQMLLNQREVLLKKRQDLDETLKRMEEKIAIYDHEIQKQEKNGNEGADR